MKVPFIGWREVKLEAADNMPRTQSLGSFYFVHSYAATEVPVQHQAATYSINGVDIVAMVRKDNLCGVQFHPERSSIEGQTFLKSFFTT